MARPTKQIGDLEYEKFEDGSDEIPVVRVKEIDGYNWELKFELMLLLLERIESELKTNNMYLKEFVEGGS